MASEEKEKDCAEIEAGLKKILLKDEDEKGSPSDQEDKNGGDTDSKVTTSNGETSSPTLEKKSNDQDTKQVDEEKQDGEEKQVEEKQVDKENQVDKGKQEDKTKADDRKMKTDDKSESDDEEKKTDNESKSDDNEKKIDDESRSYDKEQKTDDKSKTDDKEKKIDDESRSDDKEKKTDDKSKTDDKEKKTTSTASSNKKDSAGVKKGQDNSGAGSSDSNGHGDRKGSKKSETYADRKKKQQQKMKVIKKKPVKSSNQNSVEDDSTETVAKKLKTGDEKDAAVKDKTSHKENPSKKKEPVTPAMQGTENPSAPLDPSHPSVEKLRALIREEVHPLKKRSTKFPRAAYYCRLCEYHCDNVMVCERHIRDKRHRKLRETKETDLLLKRLPPLSQPHIRALNKLLDKNVEMVGLTKEATEHRQMLVKKLEKLVQEKLPDVKLELYGSSVNGFGLKGSDVNIDIVISETASPSATLMGIYKLLRDNGAYSKVRSDFTAKIPAIYFKDPVTDVECQLSVGNALAQQTTKLLATYCKIDERVRRLGVCFRYLSKICQMDKQQDGTLPAYSYMLMVIYYLQRCKPNVLPVLQELLPKGVETRPELLIEGKDCWFYDDLDNLKDVWECDNKESVAELWVKMLRFYSVDFDMNNHVVCLRTKKIVTRDEKKWSYKKLAIEDPFSTKRSVSRSVSHTKNFDYIHERLKSACKYFGVPQTKNGPLYWRLAESDTSSSSKSSSQADTKDKGKERKDSQSDKQSYSDTVSDIVSQAVEGIQGKETTPDVTERDKVSEKAESIVTGSLSGAFMDILHGHADEKLKTSIQSDSVGNVIVQTKENGADTGDDTSSSQEETPVSCKEAKKKGDIDEFAHKYVEHVMGNALKSTEDDDAFKKEDGDVTTPIPAALLRSKFGRTDSVDRYGDDDDEDITELIDAAVEEQEGDGGEELVDEKDIGDGEASSYKPGSSEGVYSEKLVDNLKQKDVLFLFERQKLCDGKKPAVMCSICQKEGHLKQNCPEENLPPISPLPTLSPEYKKLLNDILMMVPDDFMPTDKEINARKEILTELEVFIRDIYPECNLCMFGSSCNGFGFKNSDLDICMTLTTHDSPKNLNCVEIIENLATKLKTHKGLFNVFAITTAKVPIVKFKHRKSSIEGDISLYNTLALYNTKMLDNYAGIDDRVKVIGYIMKVFAKVCDIGDASRGSLSSYAYILMVLYYLQQCKPPVIPVLQELHDGPNKPVISIEGCNTWFFDDMENLSKKWPGYGKNNQTVGELWLGLLKFYTDGFNFKEHVVSIRQFKPLTRFEKLWNGKSIAIEDPFDLTHNLGAGLSRKMNTFIMKAFINGRHLFGKPVDTKIPPEGYVTFHDYFFDSTLLVDGQPPNDRGCRACGKIGHFARECPIVTARKEREHKDGRDGDRRDNGRRDGKPDDRMRRDQNQRRGMPQGQGRGMPGKQGPGGPKGNLLNQPRPPFPFPQLFYNSGMRPPFSPHFGEGRGFPPGFPGQGGPRPIHHPMFMNRNQMFGDRHPNPGAGRPSPERFQGPGGKPKDGPQGTAGRGSPNRRDEKVTENKQGAKGQEKNDKGAPKVDTKGKPGESKTTSSDKGKAGSTANLGNQGKELSAQEKLERGIGKGSFLTEKENQDKKLGPGPSPGMVRGGGAQFQKQGPQQQNMGMQGKQQNPGQGRPFQFGDKSQQRPGQDRGFGNRPGQPFQNQKPTSSIQEQFHAKHGQRPGMDQRGLAGRIDAPDIFTKSTTIVDSTGHKAVSQDVRNMVSDKDKLAQRNRDQSAGRKDNYRAPSQEKDQPGQFHPQGGRPASSQQPMRDRPFATAQQNKDRPFSSPQKPSSGPIQPPPLHEPAGRSPGQPLFGSPPKKPAIPPPVGMDQPGPKPVNRTVNIAPLGRGEKRPFSGPPAQTAWRPPVPGQVNILQRPPGGAPRPPFPIMQQDASEEPKPADTAAEIGMGGLPSSHSDGHHSAIQPPSITQYSHLQNRPLVAKDSGFIGQFIHPNAHPVARTSPVHNRPVSPMGGSSPQHLFSNTSPGHTSPRRPDFKDMAVKKRRSPPKDAPPRFQKLRQHEHPSQDMHGSPRPGDTAPSPNAPPVSAYLQPSSIPQPLQQSPQAQLAQNLMPMTPHHLNALFYIQQQQQQRLFQNQQQEKDQADIFGQRQEPTPFGHQLLGTAGFQAQHIFPLQHQFDPFRDQSQSQAEPEKTFPEPYPPHFQSQEQPSFEQQRQGELYFRETQQQPQQQQQQQPVYFGHQGQYSPQNQENFYHPASQQQSTAMTGTQIWYSSAAQQQQQQSQPGQQQAQQQQQQPAQQFGEEGGNQLFSSYLNQSRGQLSPNTQAEQGGSQGLRDPWTSQIQQPVYDPWLQQSTQPRFDQQQYASSIFQQTSEPSQVPIGNRITPVPDEATTEREMSEAAYHPQLGFGLGRGLNLEYPGN